MNRIPLTQGRFAVVDNDDFERLSKFKWRFHKGYAVRTERIGDRRITVSMHREIIGTPAGMETDHINHDRLDNRKSNLRACTRKQNIKNRPKHSDEFHSKYKGVTWHRTWKKWQAQIGNGVTTKYLGKFDCEHEAAKAYNAAATAMHGEYACLNEVKYVD